MTETADYKEKYEALYLEHINLRHELDQLKRLVFGSRHERFIPATPEEQLSLGLDAQQKEVTAAPIQKIEYTRIQTIFD